MLASKGESIQLACRLVFKFEVDSSPAEPASVRLYYRGALRAAFGSKLDLGKISIGKIRRAEGWPEKPQPSTRAY
jgi:hypothetical protein